MDRKPPRHGAAHSAPPRRSRPTAPRDSTGEVGLMKVTAAADAPVPLKTPAIPEPNGQ
jgi:hypothetical protein